MHNAAGCTKNRVADFALKKEKPFFPAQKAHNTSHMQHRTLNNRTNQQLLLLHSISLDSKSFLKRGRRSMCCDVKYIPALR